MLVFIGDIAAWLMNSDVTPTGLMLQLYRVKPVFEGRQLIA
jgi:hypothetical protein